MRYLQHSRGDSTALHWRPGQPAGGQTDGGEVRSRNGGRWRVKKKRGKERCSLVGRCVGVAKFGRGGLRKRGINGWKLLIKGVYLIKKSENTNK